MKPKQTRTVGFTHNHSGKYLKKCDYVVAVTDAMKEYMMDEGYPEERLLSVPNMLRVTKTEYKPQAFRTPLNIGFFARLVKNKGFVYLIESIKILKDRGHKVSLVIGGEGEEKSILEEKIEELGLKKDVEFYGWVQSKDDFFSKIDVFCSSSIYEPFGLNILEAMEYSKPIVATKSGGPEETIRDGKDGLLAEKESAEELADAIEAYIKDEKLAHKMAKSAHARVLENYDIKVVSKKLSKGLETTLAKRR